MGPCTSTNTESNPIFPTQPRHIYEKRDSPVRHFQFQFQFQLNILIVKSDSSRRTIIHSIQPSTSVRTKSNTTRTPFKSISQFCARELFRFRVIIWDGLSSWVWIHSFSSYNNPTSTPPYESQPFALRKHMGVRR